MEETGLQSPETECFLLSSLGDTGYLQEGIKGKNHRTGSHSDDLALILRRQIPSADIWEILHFACHLLAASPPPTTFCHDSNFWSIIPRWPGRLLAWHQSPASLVPGVSSWWLCTSALELSPALDPSPPEGTEFPALPDSLLLSSWCSRRCVEGNPHGDKNKRL